MAERDIVGGMFGVTPEMYQQNIARQSSADNLTAAQLTPGQLAGFYAMEAGTGLGRATQGLLGVEDPQMQLISRTNQLVQQIGVDTPEKLQTLASELQKLPGGGPLAIQAVDKANQMIKTGSEAQTAQQKISQEKLLREELNTLGDKATDEDILRIVRKYGTPDQVMRAVQASMDKKNAAAIKAATASSKPLPASLQKDDGKDLEAYDTYDSQKRALQPSIENLTPDAQGVRKLELGPIKNAKYAAQNLAGNSTPESRAYEGLKSAVDTAVNLQVSAEKGVQTDKDVLRFANALIAAYGRNDTQATLEALKRYNDSVDNAQKKVAARIESRRKSQNVEPYFQGQEQTAVQQSSSAPAPATREVDFNSLPKRNK
jgi:hypothetical protein